MLKRKDSSEAYHGSDAFGKSQLHKLSKSPAHFLYALEHPSPSTPAMAFGSAFHTLVLEPEEWDKRYVVASLNRRTKAGKEEAERIALAGLEPVSEEDYETLCAMRDAVMANPYAVALLAGEKEMSYYWTDPLTNVELKCRPDCRTDLQGDSVIVDLKTCGDASTDAFLRDALKYGYDLQAAQYKTGVEAFEGRKHRFVFLAVEKTQPHGINILEADELFLLKGYDDLRLYTGLVAECCRTGNWYGYMGSSDAPGMIGLPAWLAKDYE